MLREKRLPLLPVFDTHAHLDDPDVSLPELLRELDGLRAVGWRGALCAGYGPERFLAGRALCEADDRVVRACGLHPEWLAAHPDQVTREAGWRALQSELDAAGVAAVGEIGLDRRARDAFPLASQLSWMDRGLRLAAERSLPVVLHIVGWHGHALEAVGRCGVPNGGVVHRYSGPVELVPSWVAAGLYLSLSLEPREDPEKRAELARAIPADRLLVETDWPLRDHTYGQAFQALQDLCAHVAVARGETPREVAERSDRNSRALWGRPA